MLPSRFVLGTSRLADDPQKYFNEAFKLGIHTFDTGWSYGGSEHKSENALRDFIADKRDRVHLIDKMPMNLDLWNKISFQELFNTQLESLGTEYIDTYLLHCPFDDNRLSSSHIEEAALFLASLKKDGRVKSIGLSAHVDFYKAKYLMDLEEWDCVMFAYNVLTSPVASLYPHIKVWPNPGKEGFSYAKKYGMYTYSMMPLESGRVLEISRDPLFLDYVYNFVTSSKDIDSVLIGTTNLDRLKKVVNEHKTR